MKKINYFFDKTPMWKVVIVYYICFSLISYLIFKGVFYYTGVEQLEVMKHHVILKISITSGLLFSIVLSLSTHLRRKSQKFWDYSREVEHLIDDASTKDSIQKIWQNEFLKLIRLSSGGIHNMELHRLKAIMETKIKYIS